MSEPSVPPPPPPTYTPPPPPAGPSSVSPNRTLMIILSYLGILAIIPLVAEKDDREVQWHAKNGLAIFVAEILVTVLVMILTSVISFVDMGCSGCILNLVLIVMFVVVAVLGITKGLNGQRLIIPGVSDFANKF
jgi:uncharacterized membrane protein